MRTAALTDNPSDQYEAVSWDAHFIKRHPKTRLRIAFAALATFGCALTLFHHLVIALLATCVLLASVAEFLLPLRYTLDAQGARVSCGPVTWLEMPWQDVRSVYRTRDGVKLSVFPSRTAFMEPMRGITLRCSPEMLPRVLSAAQAFRATEAQAAP